MSIYEGISNIIANHRTAEEGKFLQLTSSDFPAISVTRVKYPDTTGAYPQNAGVSPVSSVEIYPKYAVLSHITNPTDIAGSTNTSPSYVAYADSGQMDAFGRLRVSEPFTLGDYNHVYGLNPDFINNSQLSN